MSKSKGKNIKQSFRPQGWPEKVEALVKFCMEEGEIISEDEGERSRQEAFVRLCLNTGADALMELFREYSPQAEVIKGRIFLVRTAVAVPGKPRLRDLGMGFKTREGFAGPGRITFIPNDQVKFIVED